MVSKKAWLKRIKELEEIENRRYKKPFEYIVYLPGLEKLKMKKNDILSK